MPTMSGMSTVGTLNDTDLILIDVITNPVNSRNKTATVTVLKAALAGSATPLSNGTATAGTATTFSREDHVHPSDTSLAPKASPALTGTPTAPTAVAGTNTTQIATTAFVTGALGDYLTTAAAAATYTTPGAVAATYAPLASPALTGNPTAPTQSAGNNSTRLATTEYVDTGLALKSNTTRTVNAQTGTTYTLVLSDAGKVVTLSNAAAITLTIPLNSSVAFPVGTQIDLLQLGAGQVSVSPTGGVTLVSDTSKRKINVQYGGAVLLKTDTDTWVLFGNLTA
jgi:hypothetical protein